MMRFLAGLLCWHSSRRRSPRATSGKVSTLQNKIYLYGTIHAGKKEWFPLGARSRTRSRTPRCSWSRRTSRRPKIVKVGERDDRIPRAIRSRSTSGRSNMRASVKLLARYAVPESAVERMKPFMAVSLLVVGEWAAWAIRPSTGIDAYLLAKARAGAEVRRRDRGRRYPDRAHGVAHRDENRTIFAGTLTALEAGSAASRSSSWSRPGRRATPRHPQGPPASTTRT
jgi:hypothetical protein